MVKTKLVSIRTEKNRDVRNISDLISSAVLESKIRDGIAVVFSQHTTMGLFLANYDPTLVPDVTRFLSELVPNHPDYVHNQSETDPNTDAHLKSILVGSSVSIPIIGGRLALGQWQAIFLVEFEGPRARQLTVQMVGD